MSQEPLPEQENFHSQISLTKNENYSQSVHGPPTTQISSRARRCTKTTRLALPVACESRPHPPHPPRKSVFDPKLGNDFCDANQYFSTSHRSQFSNISWTMSIQCIIVTFHPRKKSIWVCNWSFIKRGGFTLALSSPNIPDSEMSLCLLHLLYSDSKLIQNIHYETKYSLQIPDLKSPDTQQNRNVFILDLQAQLRVQGTTNPVPKCPGFVKNPDKISSTVKQVKKR